MYWVVIVCVSVCVGAGVGGVCVCQCVCVCGESVCGRWVGAVLCKYDVFECDSRYSVGMDSSQWRPFCLLSDTAPY